MIVRIISSGLLVLALASCAGAPPATSTSPAPAPPRAQQTSAPARAEPPDAITVAARAQAVLARAANTEPDVTPKLVAMAEEMGGSMYKLEHRLKTQASTERKIRKEMAEGQSLDEVVIDDALRYTVRVDDEPPGRHVEAIKRFIDELTTMGHEVVRLKNYWPRDDNYSGINGIFHAPNGLLWELQFHTTDSLRVQAETRAMYEELRRVATPLERKRELFDAMTKAWSQVPVPKGILVEGAIHPKAEILDRPRP